MTDLGIKKAVNKWLVKAQQWEALEIVESQLKNDGNANRAKKKRRRLKNRWRKCAVMHWTSLNV